MLVWIAEPDKSTYDALIEKVNELSLNYKYVERRMGDVPSLWADTTLANEELGWKATRTLEETLKSAWEWEKYVAQKENK